MNVEIVEKTTDNTINAMGMKVGEYGRCRDCYGDMILLRVYGNTFINMADPNVTYCNPSSL